MELLKVIYSSYTTEKAENELKQYLHEDEIKYLENVLDIRKLISLIRYLDIFGFRVKDVEIVTEGQELVFVKIVTNAECEMKTWTSFTKSIKEYLKETGFSDIAGMVGILCQT